MRTIGLQTASDAMEISCSLQVILTDKIRGFLSGYGLAQVRKRSGCPIDFALDVFGDRWTLLVIRDLVFGGKRHFKEFMDSPEGIASNILATRLKRLEAQGLISRRIDPQSRKQLVYELTDKGLDLVPTLIDIIAWGAKYDPKTGAPKSFLERIKKDRDGVIRETIASIRQHPVKTDQRSA